MKELKVVSVLEVDGKEMLLSDLKPEELKELSERIQDKAMGPGFKRKTA